jgi:hypothetical protein
MAKKQVTNATANIAAEFTKLFGPPPLFKTEDNAIYNAILEGLAQDEKPRSFIARILVRDVADLVYQRLWLGGLGTRLIRQAHKEKLEVSAEIAKTEVDRLKKALLSSVKPKTDVPNAEKSESDAEKAVKAKIDGIDAVLKEHLTQLRKAEDGPVDDAALFRIWIERYERVQSLIAAVDKKFSDTLKLLDEYRHGLGQRVRQVADEIVDAEFVEDPLAACEQVAIPASSASQAQVPSTREMLPPSVASPR